MFKKYLNIFFFQFIQQCYQLIPIFFKNLVFSRLKLTGNDKTQHVCWSW